ncbi:MAG: hypothetical protein EXS05_14030 [Planctomycetaceae bacterium]|nr:hypothetical protein [Planctomycetaceae bacterium]
MSTTEVENMGRVTVDFVIANNRDVLFAPKGTTIPGGIGHVELSGVVDTGATQLVLPERLVEGLKLIPSGEVWVKYADQRRKKRKRVSNVWLILCDRASVFEAIIEPDRTDALIGAIVLEQLDLIVDCVAQTLHPRDPKGIVAEIE